MSKSELSRILKDKWAEGIVFAGLFYLASVVWHLDVSVASLGARIDGLNAKVEGTHSLIEAADSKLSSTIASNQNSMKERLDSIDSFGSSNQLAAKDRMGRIEWRLEKIVDKLDGLSTSFAELNGRLIAVDKRLTDFKVDVDQHSHVQLTSHKSTSPVTRSITQTGIFGPNSKVEGTANVYHWKMLATVDLRSVTSIRAVFEEPIPGTALTAKIVEDGTVCEMTIISNKPEAVSEMVAKGIVGSVTITLLVSPIPNKEPPTSDGG